MFAWLQNAEWLMSPDDDLVVADIYVLWRVLGPPLNGYIDRSKGAPERQDVLQRARRLFEKIGIWTEMGNLSPPCLEIAQTYKRVVGLL